MMQALLFTDLEGSTSLWERSPVAMADALAEHDRIVRTAIEQHGGTIFTTAGDSFAAVFTGPSDAATAAAEIQRNLLDFEWRPSTPIRARIGIHVGETVERDGDHFGPAVNRAARVCDAGHGGQILLSEDATRGALSIRTLDLGPHRLKGVGEAVGLYQLLGDDLPFEFPPIRTLGTSRVDVPVGRSDLIGRSSELEAIRAALVEHRVVTLTGTGGVGKTQLAIGVAASASPDFVDGAVFVDLSAVSDDDDVARAVADRLHTTDSDIFGGLADCELLLVLDNCEQVVDAVATLVDELVVATRALTVLATSRESLDVESERTIRVRGLEPADALDLFISRSAPGAVSTDEDRAAAALVCSRLDHIPLAIELAAARTRSLDVRAMPSRLEDRFRLLTGGRRRTRGRQQTLETTIAWSYGLLDSTEALALRKLSVFSGRFLLDLAASLLEVDEVEALDLLDTLVAKSLVEASRPERGFDQTEYSLLESIRVFALERLIEDGRVDHVRAQLCDALVTEAPLTIWGGHQAYVRSADIYSAMLWAAETGDEHRRRSIQLAYAAAIHSDGRVAEAQRLMTEVLDFETAPRQRSLALSGLGIGAAYEGRILEARSFVDDAVRLDPANPVALVSLFLLGSVAAGLDRPKALADLELLDGAADNPALRGLPAGLRSMMATWDGDMDAAADHAAVALSLGNRDQIGTYCTMLELRLLALAHSADPTRAMRWVDEDPLALSFPRFYRGTDSARSYAIDLDVCLSVASIRANERTRAHRHLAEAVALADHRSPQPHRNRQALALGLAYVLFDEGDAGAARALLRAIDAPSGGMVPGMVHVLADIEEVSDDTRADFIRTEPIIRLFATDDTARAERDALLELAIGRYGLRS